MRPLGTGLVCIALAACAHTPPPASIDKVPPATLPAVEPPPRTLSLGELGAEGMSAEWIELQMPEDARVLAYTRDVPVGRETWTLIASGTRRVLRVRFEEGKEVGQAAWAGTANKDSLELRLVEVRGKVRFTSERLAATCRTDKVCEEGKPSRRAAATMCTFEDSAGLAEVAFFAPGKGIDFVVGSCPYAEERDRRPRRTALRGF